MIHSRPLDGFRLAYDITGPTNGQPVVLLHGWPGDRTDYRLVSPLLSDRFRIVVPDLRGFGDSDRHLVDPANHYSPAAQARSVAALIDELDLNRPIVGGYDIGSRIAQTLAAAHPERLRGLVLSPPLPGIGDRVLTAEIVPELWYMYFHRSPLAVTLLDGDRDAVRSSLRHFWTHWSGPDFTVDGPDFERLIDNYARPGAFEAATNWYRTGPGYVAANVRGAPPPSQRRLQLPVQVLWQDHDPLFPRSWSDRLDQFFANVHVTTADRVGHFTPLEAPERFAELVRAVA